MQSIHSFFNNRLESIKNYPGAYLCALGIAIVGMILNHNSNRNNMELNNILARLLASGLFVLPLMTVAPLLKQINTGFPTSYTWRGQLDALILWAIYFFFLPEQINNSFGAEQMRVALSVLFTWTIPLLVIAFSAKKDQNEVRWWSWQFLFTLFIAWISAVIVGWGIAASVASIEYLFDLQVNSTIYTDIWICAFALAGVTVWLVGLCDEEKTLIYSKLLRFFWLYIFLPLATLYACILLVYGLKIAISQELPRGVISWMVIGYSTFGLIAYLFTYILKRDYKWIQKIHNRYFISLIVFSILLFVAIGVRIGEYGLTSPRYLIVMFGLWIVAISIVSFVNPKYSLTAIVWLFVILLWISTFGPRSAVNLPTQLQYQKLVKLLESNNFLVNGYIQTPTSRVDASQGLTGNIEIIYQTADYLAQERGASVFQPLFSASAFEHLSGTNRYEVGEQFMVAIGVDNATVNSISDSLDDGYINFYYDGQSKALDISDYSYIIPLTYNIDQLTTPEGIKVSLVNDDMGRIIIIAGNKTYDINLYEHLGYIRAAHGWGPSLELKGANYTIILNEFTAQEKVAGEYSVKSYGGYVLVK